MRRNPRLHSIRQILAVRRYVSALDAAGREFDRETREHPWNPEEAADDCPF